MGLHNMRTQRILNLSMLVTALTLHGCLFGIVDLRLRSEEVAPIEVGFDAQPEVLARRLVPYVEGSKGHRGLPVYGQWKTIYRGGNTFVAFLSWRSFSLTAQVQVLDDRVELLVLESEGLNQKDGRIHSVAAAQMETLRKTVGRGVRLERTDALLVKREVARASPSPALNASDPARPKPGPQVPATVKPPMTALVESTPAFDESYLGRYHALVIGNNQYAKLPVLRTPVPDAAVVSSLLELDYGFDVELLANATRSQIISALNRYRARLGESDNLLVYYAGHGWFDEEAQRGYWLPVDAKQDDPSNWLSNPTITDLIRVIPAKHVMVVADSCYSGTLTRGINMRPRRDRFLERMARKRARTVLTSGGLEPVEDGSGRHSVFAGAFIEALRSNEHVMDGTDLFNSIRHSVMLESDQTPEYGDIRRAGHDGGDFLFVRTR
jgi:hypothetical protein